jgi:DNA-binding transcriptional LysR family regulator
MGELMAFVALHQAGTFTGAARVLHLSQAGFSARILRLERAVGEQLVDRTVRPAALTAAGESFLPYAFALLQAMADGRAAAHGAQRQSRPAVPA